MSALPPKADIAERDHHVDAVRRKVRGTTAPGQAVSCGRSDEPNWRSRLSPIEEIFFQLAAAHQAPSLFQVRSGCVFERPIGQEWTRSRMDPLLLPVLITPALCRQSAFMTIRAADAASLIGKINSMSHARCMAE